MAGVKAHGMAVALKALVKVFIGKVLVASQGVGICEAGVQLQRPLKELEGILMLLQGIMQARLGAAARREICDSGFAGLSCHADSVVLSLS